MKVLVTGGAGFIGSNLCKRLLKENYHVICVDNFLTSSKQNIQKLLKDKQFLFVEHDVIKPLPTGISADVVFHLASPASPNHHSKISYHALPMETMLVNTVGTLELLKFAAKNKAKFLFASTSEVYGNPLKHPQNEKYRGNVSTTGPRSVYDEAKRFGETLTAYFYREKDLDVRTARIFNTYGPGMAKIDKRMIVTIITQSIANKPITLFGEGTQTRCLCYIDDMVEALIRLMFYPGTKGQVVNLGAQNEQTVLEYAQLVTKILDSKSVITFSEKLPTDDPKRRKPDISKAKKLLDWEPKVRLEDGLKKTIDYFRQLSQ